MSSKNKNTKSKEQSPEIEEKILGATQPPVEEQVIEEKVQEEPITENQNGEPELEEDEPLYTLRDNALFVPGFGTILKDPKNIQPLTERQLKAMFEYAKKDGYSKEYVIKKHLEKIVRHVDEVQPEKRVVMEKYVLDKE
jgi:hypothetical protein